MVRAILLCDDIYFNGAFGYEYNVKLALFDNKNEEKDSGIDYDVLNSIAGASSTYMDYGVKLKDPLQLQGCFIKCPCDNDTYEYSVTEQRQILTWLTKTKSLSWLKIYDNEVETVSYLCRVISITRKLINDKVVGFDVTWETNSPFAYSGLIEESYTSTGSLILDNYYCDSDDSDFLYPKMEIEVDSSELTIITESPVETRTTTLKNLLVGDTVYLDNLNRFIYSRTDKKFNTDFNWIFVRLTPRQYNKITVNGSCDLKVKYRLPRRIGEY